MASREAPVSILARVAAGDPGATSDCIAQYGDLVWSLARRMTSSTPDAEDMVQEIFIEVWRNAGRYDSSRAAETTFIATIARRRLIDHHRKQSRQPNTEIMQEDSISSREPEALRPEIQEQVVRVRDAMRELRAEERQVLELALIKDWSQSRIAEETGMPLGTVKTHARRGLQKLRQTLDRDS